MSYRKLCVCALLSAVFLFLLLPSGGRAAQDMPPEGWTGIYTRADLEKITLNPDGQYILMNDIDLTGEDWRGLCSEELPFTGTLDGGGYTVYGMVTSSESSPAGLFTSLWGGTVTDLTVAGMASGSVVGLLAGKSCDAVLTGCTARGTVNTTFCGGGLVGQISGTCFAVKNSAAECTVAFTGTGGDEIFLGGLAGAVYGTGAQIESCETAGTLSFTGEQASVGGIAGVFDGAGTVTDCGSEAALTLSLSDRGTVGGILGRTGEGAVSLLRCSFRADWSVPSCAGSLRIGGIVGQISASESVSVTGCVAYGSIRSAAATSAIGGIVGSSLACGGDVTVSRSSSFAFLSGTGCPLFIGGICGENRGDAGTALIENCHADGAVTCTGTVNGDTSLWFGGICGINGGEDSSRIRLSFSSCDVAVSYPMGDGAVVGMSYPFGDGGSVTVDRCYYRAGVREFYATPVPGASLSDPASFAGFDFESVWLLDSSVGMPRLRDAESASGALAGDVDGNGRLTEYDARLLAQYLTGRVSLTDGQLARADMDGDGRADARDVTLILRNLS